MDVREVQITFDTHDPEAEAQFWAEVLGYEPDPPPAGFATWDAALRANGIPEDEWNDAAGIHDPEGDGPRIYFQRVPEEKTVKNRVHLDVRAAPGKRGEARMAALEAEAVRLVSLGAERVRRVEPDKMVSAGYIVMRDPEGNEFCLD